MASSQRIVTGDTSRLGRLAAPPPLGRLAARPVRGLDLTQLTAWLAIGFVIAVTATTAVFAASGPSILVPRSPVAFPGWMAGPLHGLFGRLPEPQNTLEIFSSAALVGMFCAYGVALASIRAVSMRCLWIVVGVL